MGLREEILPDLLDAMSNELSQAVEPYIAKRRIDAGWDEENDKPIEAEYRSISGKGIFLSTFSYDERQTFELKVGDVKLIIPNGNEKPLLSDLMVIKGRIFHIVDEIIAPAEVIYTLQLRELSQIESGQIFRLYPSFTTFPSDSTFMGG